MPSNGGTTHGPDRQPNPLSRPPIGESGRTRFESGQATKADTTTRDEGQGLMCDNCKQVRFELDRQWGNGQVDYPKLRAMLSNEDRADDE